jgi:hypothetical protein
MERGFFPTGRADWAVIIVALDFVLLSSENVAQVQLVHQE